MSPREPRDRCGTNDRSELRSTYQSRGAVLRDAVHMAAAEIATGARVVAQALRLVLRVCAVQTAERQRHEAAVEALQSEARDAWGGLGVARGAGDILAARLDAARAKVPALRRAVVSGTRDDCALALVALVQELGA